MTVMLKEAHSMILGPCLIFCINYIQRKLKRCFSRAQHFLHLHYIGKSTMEKLNYTSSAMFSVVWSWGGDQLLGFCSSIPESPRGAGLKDRWGATLPPQTTVPAVGGGGLHHRVRNQHAQIPKTGRQWWDTAMSVYEGVVRVCRAVLLMNLFNVF